MPRFKIVFSLFSLPLPVSLLIALIFQWVIKRERERERRKKKSGVMFSDCCVKNLNKDTEPLNDVLSLVEIWYFWRQCKHLIERKLPIEQKYLIFVIIAFYSWDWGWMDGCVDFHICVVLDLFNLKICWIFEGLRVKKRILKKKKKLKNKKKNLE